MSGWAPPISEDDPVGEASDAGDVAEDLEQLVDPLADGIPDTAQEAQQQLAPAIADLLDAGAAQVVLPLMAIALVALVVGLIRRRLVALPDAASPGPPAVGAALACVGLYLFGRLVDPLLSSLLSRPAWFPADSWPQVGWFEWRLLGRPWAWGALPLADHPGLAIVIHVIVWAAIWALLRFVLEWVWGGELRWSEPASDLPGDLPGALPRYYRFVGASTTRRADRRFRRWLGPMVTLMLPIHVMAGLRLAESPGATPAPGSWVVAGLLLWTTAFHLLVSGRPPLEKKQEDEAEAEGLADEQPPGHRAALARLREAVEQLRPGVELEALEQREAVAGRRVDFPAAIAPLVRELFDELGGGAKLWSHQAEVLVHLGGLWRMQASAGPGEIPTLAEERANAVVSVAETSTPHALMLAPEGSGRTTVTLLAALHVFFDRGATSLVIVRDRAAAKTWVKTLARALLGSSARWNVLVCLAGEDLSAALVSERTPAIVVADLETCESEVLCDPRTDDFLARLGLVVAEDVDGFTGVAEMHLQLCMRRLWALLSLRREQAYPVALLATAGEGASGMDAWAKHVLAVPLRLFCEDGAASRPRVLLRRRDLVDGVGSDIPLSVLAEACDLAELPWHLRLAGDRDRGVRRAAFDLGNLRHHHREDPREAAIVIVEGTYPDVRREADRLAHAGVGLDPAGYPPRSPVVLVLAPPGDEEMVLHEEAEDAVHRRLVASLPRAVPLAEPRLVRQRHFDRAIGREQELDALRERLGASFVDETVARLGDALSLREVLSIDPSSDEIVPRTLLRSVKEAAMGQTIDAACVSDRSSRTLVVDAGTSETLLSADSAIARAVYPPGRIFLHPRGRFMVIDEHGATSSSASRGSSQEGELLAEQVDGRERTSNDRITTFEPSESPAWADRQFGGRPLPVALVGGQICEELWGMRRFAPGPTLVDQRVYERPIEVRYGTDACLVATGADPRPDRGGREASEVLHGDGAEPAEGAEPADELLIPLAAALRMILPCYLRAGSELVDVDIVELSGHRLLCIYDRTAGASGFARFVCERGLRELLILARMVLERLVGPEFARLRHIHDRTPGSDPSRWRIADALRWLDEVLDPPPEELGGHDEEAAKPRPSALGGPRVEFVPGEGRGDLGRLWVSHSGRTDDLVWTRHGWWSQVEIGGQGPGRVFFDVAVERPAIAAARRRAIALAGLPAMQRRERLDLHSSETHEHILAADRADLEPIRAELARLCGDPAVLVETILALVAAMPISPRPLSVADRGPLAVLTRRRADLDAKLLLACALLPAEASPEIVAGPEDEAWLRVRSSLIADTGRVTWDLGGPRPRPVAEEPAQRATLVLEAKHTGVLEAKHTGVLEVKHPGASASSK